MMGTSPALTSTSALSTPKPAKADSKCSTVEILTSPRCNVVPIVVSPTFCGMRLDVHRLVEIGAAEHDARIRRRRTQRHEDLLPRVQTHPRGSNRILQCSLIQHLGDRISDYVNYDKGITGRTWA